MATWIPPPTLVAVLFATELPLMVKVPLLLSIPPPTAPGTVLMSCAARLSLMDNVSAGV
jgi:hypothetical protein